MGQKLSHNNGSFMEPEFKKLNQDPLFSAIRDISNKLQAAKETKEYKEQVRVADIKKKTHVQHKTKSGSTVTETDIPSRDTVPAGSDASSPTPPSSKVGIPEHFSTPSGMENPYLVKEPTIKNPYMLFTGAMVVLGFIIYYL